MNSKAQRKHNQKVIPTFYHKLDYNETSEKKKTTFDKMKAKTNKKNLTTIFSTTNDGDYKFKFFNNLEGFNSKATKTELKKLLYPMFKNQTHSLNIFKQGRRLNTKWKMASGIMIDIDNGKSIKEAIEILKKEEVSYYIIPSKSHQIDKKGITCDRFHIYIKTDQIITDKNIHKMLTNYFSEILQSDIKAKDLARFFGPTPNLKIDDIIINTKGELSKKKIKKLISNIDNREFEYTKKKKKIKEKSESEYNNININEEAITNFLKHVNNRFPQLISENLNPSNSSFSFYRNKKDKNPGVYCLYDDTTIHDNNGKKYNLTYSLQNFNETVDCYDKVPEIDELLTEITNEIYAEPEKSKLYMFRDNEGTGKSYGALRIIKKGDFFLSPDKKRQEEVNQILNTQRKEHIILFSNMDIIANVIAENRGLNSKDLMKLINKIAYQYNKSYIEEIVEWNENDKEHINNISKNHLEFTQVKSTHNKKLLKKYSSKWTKENKKIISNKEVIKNKDLSDDEKADIITSNSGLKQFLDKNKDLNDNEKEAILIFYNNQISNIIKKDKIILTTHHKFATMVSLISELHDGVSPIIAHMDEIIPDLFNSYKVVTSSNSKSFITLINDAVNNTPDTYTLESYTNNVNVLTKKEFFNKWWEVPFLNIIAYTTETAPIKMIASYNKSYENNYFDISHRILTDNIKIIGVQSLNSQSKNGQVLKGKQKGFFVIENIMKELDVKKENIIMNGVGQKWNLKNNKGSNKFVQTFNKLNQKENIAIVITNPHPNEIDSQKAIYVPMCENEIKDIENEENRVFTSTERHQYIHNRLNSDELTEMAKKDVIIDKTQQALGRLAGYRKHKNVKNIYLIISDNLLQYLHELNYVTPNVLTYTSLYASKQNQEIHYTEWEFIKKMTLLSSTEDNLQDKLEDKNLSLDWFNDIYRTIKHKIKQFYNDIESLKYKFNYTISTFIQKRMCWLKKKYKALYILRNKILSQKKSNITHNYTKLKFEGINLLDIEGIDINKLIKSV